MKNVAILAFVFSIFVAIFTFCLFACDMYIVAVIATCCYLALSIDGVAVVVKYWKDKK